MKSEELIEHTLSIIEGATGVSFEEDNRSSNDVVHVWISKPHPITYGIMAFTSKHVKLQISYQAKGDEVIPNGLDTYAAQAVLVFDGDGPSVSTGRRIIFRNNHFFRFD